MNAFGELRDSFAGWSEIVAGRGTAAQRFVLSRPGLAVAVGWFVVAILLSLVVQSIVVGVPPTTQLLFGIVAELVTLALLGLGLRQALRWLRAETPTLTLLVPTTYLLAYMFVVSIPLQLLSAVLGVVVLLLVALLIGRAGQVLCGLKPMAALAVAGVCVLVLVVVPNALYMLLLLFPSA
ncbi:MAG: hypothetical protein BGO82_12775 [Devosia sp. 67-54]|uniref:hypothetical protein n=1 Tax=unclassified Devosia TaxID=196773 RepID=UPI00095E28B1|nr:MULTISPECIES: hypothetical protein [unclassified Devosia]MBN9304481.1 hypothetical protein [Devosia sp.]OJX15517.1 MAG: hypothetical protein BGO82_12775 [Devosia sp. 67-54]